MAIACKRCGSDAAKQFGNTQEPVCLSCFTAPGVCSGCGKNFGDDSSLIRVGQAKNCGSCQARLAKQTDDIFKPGMHF